MQQTNITTGAQTVTSTGAVIPTTGLDISALSGDYGLELEVEDLHSASGAPGASIIFEDTVNAFSAAVPIAEFSFTGPIQSGAPVKVSIQGRNAAGLRLGTASAKLRVNVVRLSGGTPSCTLRAGLWN